MELTNNQNKKDNCELSIADLLCSAGYLPPRNEHDVERFERIYCGRKFETETYNVNANAIFDKVIGVDESKTRKIMTKTTIFESPGMLRVAEGAHKSYNDSIAESFNKLIKNKED